MAIKYVPVKRMIHVGYNPGEKYVAKIAQDNLIDIWKVADMISETSALSKGDILSVLIQYETILEWSFFEGNAIQLGRMGKLIPGFHATAVDTIEEVNATTIKRIFVRFSPTKRFSKRLKEAKVAPMQLNFKGLQLPTEPTPEPPTP